MPAIDMTNVFRGFEGLWVAIVEDPHSRVVGSGKTLKEASEVAKRNGYSHPAYCKAPDPSVSYIL